MTVLSDPQHIVVSRRGRHRNDRRIGGILATVILVLLSAAAILWLGPRKAASVYPTASSRQVEEFFGSSLVIRSGGSFGFDHIEFHSVEGEPFSRFLRVLYPAHSASARAAASDHGITTGGAQVYLRFASGQVDHAYLRYWVRFPHGFQWVKGGKLPGFYGGTVTSGQHIPNGIDGLSTRYMWRAGGAGEVYAYLPTSIVHGTSLGRGDWHWPVGRWACIQQQVVLNDPGRADGRIQVWLDRHQVLDRSGLTYRSSPSLGINGLFFSTFFGGSDASWASPTNQHIDFAGFAVGAHYLGC